MRPITALTITAGAAATVFAVDWGTKALARHAIPEDESGPKLGPFTTTHVEHYEGLKNGLNPGTKASLGFGMGLGGVFGAYIAYRAPKSPNGVAAALAAASGLVLGAAIGNGVEMLTRDSVTDFIDIPPNPDPDQEYLVANVADLATGTGLLLALGGVGGAVVHKIVTRH